MKVGYVILNFNNNYITQLTLDALLRAKSNYEQYVVLIDNASKFEDQEKLRQYYEANFKNRFKSEFIVNKTNLGYSGGNNVGIKKLLKDKSITHICLHNSDVIVSDYWIDRLLEASKDVVAPVTNAVGNEQTVSKTYDVDKNFEAFDVVNEFSQKWYSVRKNWIVESKDLHFFSIVFHRTVFEKIGVLDELFYPGSFEDVDFCFRLEKAGIPLHIHRGVFIHHYGSASFEKLDMTDRLNISNQNRLKLEKKWKFEWQSDDPKIFLSYKQDVDFIFSQKQKELYGEILDLQAEKILGLISNLNKSNKYLLMENERLRSNPVYHEPLIKRIKRIIKTGLLSFSSIIKFIVYPFKGVYFQIAKRLLKRVINGKSIFVIAPYFNEQLLKDGYFKRVKIIDELLADYLKLYVDTNYSGTDLLFQKNDDNSITIFYNQKSRKQNFFVSLLLFISRKVYFHSVLRFENWENNPVLLSRLCKIYWDVHGVVPEEFEYHKDYYSAQKFNDLESKLAKLSSLIIVVTDKMLSYVSTKHGFDRSKMLLMPYIIDDNVPHYEKKYESKPIVTYAGGTIKWQMIELMQEVIFNNINKAKYQICVPVTSEFWNTWNHPKPDKSKLTVQSKTYQSLKKTVYNKANYGFALRENVVVNKVACPTKIVEYIQHDIVPILFFSDIGDFSEMGLSYLSIDNLEKNGFLTRSEYLKAIENNRKVFSKYLLQCSEGVRSFKKIFD